MGRLRQGCMGRICNLTNSMGNHPPPDSFVTYYPASRLPILACTGWNRWGRTRMKTFAYQSTVRRLETAIIAFFAPTSLSLLIIFFADPAIYTRTLMLMSSPTERYSVAAILFLISILAFIILLIIGVVRHWRWVFWHMLVAFCGAALQIPVTLLQIAGVLPASDPLLYSLFRIAVGIVELALAVWMISIYRRAGVWAMGKKRPLPS